MESARQDEIEVAGELARAALAPRRLGDAAAGARHRLAADLFGQGVRGPRPARKRAAAGQELEEHRAERVDVGRRGHRFAADLLRRCVGGSQRQRGRARPSGRVAGQVTGRIEELRDAEIEQAHSAVGRDEDVRRLQVAVDHQPRVRRGDRPACFGDQPEDLGHAEMLLIGEARDRHALDQLEREVGPAVVRDATVQQPGDAGVIEPGQDLALAEEAAHELARVEVAAHQLERDLLLELAVGALGAPDLAHAAPPEELAQRIRTDTVAGSGTAGARRPSGVQC